MRQQVWILACFVFLTCNTAGAQDGDISSSARQPSNVGQLMAKFRKQFNDGDLREAQQTIRQVCTLEARRFGDDNWRVLALRVQRDELDALVERCSRDAAFAAKLQVVLSATEQVRQLVEAREIKDAVEVSAALKSAHGLLPDAPLHRAFALDARARALCMHARQVQTEEAYNAAVAACAEAMELFRSVHGGPNPHFANVLDALGSVHQAYGKLDQARKERERALTIRISALGETDLEVAISCVNLGNLCHECGEIRDAARLFERALSISKRDDFLSGKIRFAANHQLGVALMELGDQVKAEKNLEAAVEWAEPNLQPLHPIRITLYRNYSDALRAVGREREARFYADRSELVDQARNQSEFIPRRNVADRAENR